VRSLLSRHSLLLTLLALVGLSGCAPKSKKSETTLKLFSSFSASGLNMDGGALIYGRTTDGANTFSRVFKGNSEFTIDINYGNWNFSVVTYAGSAGEEVSGALECASVSGVAIQKDQSSVDLSVSPAKCQSAGIRNLKIKPCTIANFNIVAGGSPFSTCGGVGGDGGILSYKISLLSHENSTLLPSSLTSRCVEAADFEGAGPPMLVPSGLTGASRSPIRILGYTATGCSGAASPLYLSSSLSNPNPSNLFYSQAAGASLFLAINIDGPGLDTTPPALTLNTPSIVVGDSKNWINSSSQASFQVNGTCEASDPISITIGGSSVAGGPFNCNVGTYNFNLDLSAYAENLAGAPYVLRVIQTDPAGNTTNIPRPLYKDTLAPTVTTPVLLPINISNVNAYDFSGTCDSNGALVTGLLGGLNFSSTCDGTGWNIAAFDTSALGDGNPAFTANITDFAGNVTALPIPATIKDTTPPIAATSPSFNSANTVTNTVAIPLTWVSASAHSSYRVDFYNASCTALTSSLSLASGATSTTFSAPFEGTFSYKVVAIDPGLNENPSACSNNVTYDMTPPLPATGLAVSQATLTNDNTLDYNWVDATDPGGVGIANYRINFYTDAACSIVKDAFQTIAAPANTYTTLALSEGLTHFTIEAFDSAGNTSSSACGPGVEIDVTPPTPAQLNATNWLTASGTTKKNIETKPWGYAVAGDVLTIDIILRRDTCAGAIVQQNNAVATATTSAQFEISVEGAYFYEIITRDAATNESSSCSSSLIVNQEAMGVGGEYIDGFTIGTDHLYALTRSGLEIFDVSGLPAMPKLKTLKVKGFIPTRAAYDSDHIYLYNASEAHIWTTTGSGTLANPSYVAMANTGMTGIVDHAFSPGYVWFHSATQLGAIEVSSPTTPVTQPVLALGAAGCTALEYVPTAGTGHLYAACGTNLIPIDIGTPSSPAVVGSVPSSVVNNDLIYDPTTDFLYTTGPSDGGHISRFDVTTTPTTPAILAGERLTGFGNGKTFGNIAGNYVSHCFSLTGTKEASVIDISPVGSPPTNLRHLNADTSTCSRTVMNSTDFFALTDKGIHIGPVTAGAIANDPNPYLNVGKTKKLAVNSAGSLAFASHDGDKAQIYDLANKEKPSPAYTFTSGNFRRAVFRTDDEIVAIVGTNLKRYDLTSPSAPVAVGPTMNLAGSLDKNASLVVDSSNRAYIGEEDGRVTVYDVITGVKLVNSKQICPATAGNSVMSLLLRNNYLIATCKLSRKVYSVNASNPAVSFNVVANIDLVDQPTSGNIGFNTNGNILYLPIGPSGLQIVTLAGNGTLTDVGAFSTGGEALSATMPTSSTTLLFVGKDNGLATYDTSTPTTPVLRDFEQGPGRYEAIVPSDNTATPNYIFGAASEAGVQVFNVSDPNVIHQ